MGDVYLAEDHRMQRRVVLKTIRADKARDPEFQKRIEREWQIHARIKSHTHIVALHDRLNIRSQQVLIMEYVDGETLQERLERYRQQGRVMALQDALLIASQCLDALSAIHFHKVVHRDIKPANLMLTLDEEERVSAKLMDFGIARHTEEGSAIAFPTGNNTPGPGTPAYMAPEQIDSRRFGSVSEATDVYAVGIMLYEMITGAPPFGGTLTDILMGHLMHPVPPLRPPQGAGVPPEVADIIHHALAKNPKLRFPSAKAFRDELRHLLESLPFPDTDTQDMESGCLEGVDSQWPDDNDEQATLTPADSYSQADVAGMRQTDQTHLGTTMGRTPEQGQAENVNRRWLGPVLAVLVVVALCFVAATFLYNQRNTARMAEAEMAAKAAAEDAAAKRAALTEEIRAVASIKLAEGDHRIERANESLQRKDFATAKSEFAAAAGQYSAAEAYAAAYDAATDAKNEAERARDQLLPGCDTVAAPDCREAGDHLIQGDTCLKDRDCVKAKEQFALASAAYARANDTTRQHDEALTAKQSAEEAKAAVDGKQYDTRTADDFLAQAGTAWDAANFVEAKARYESATKEYESISINPPISLEALAEKVRQANEMGGNAKRAKAALPADIKDFAPEDIAAGDDALARAAEAMDKGNSEEALRQYTAALERFDAAKSKVSRTPVRVARPPGQSPSDRAPTQMTPVQSPAIPSAPERPTVFPSTTPYPPAPPRSTATTQSPSRPIMMPPPRPPVYDPPSPPPPQRPPLRPSRGLTSLTPTDGR